MTVAQSVGRSVGRQRSIDTLDTLRFEIYFGSPAFLLQRSGVYGLGLSRDCLCIRRPTRIPTPSRPPLYSYCSIDLIETAAHPLTVDPFW